MEAEAIAAAATAAAETGLVRVAESVPGRLCERRALGRYGGVGTTGSEGTEREAGESAGLFCRSQRAPPVPPGLLLGPGCFCCAQAVGVTAPRPHLCGLQPSRRAYRGTRAPEAASRPRSPRGGGPRRTGALRDQPLSVHRPRTGAGWARRGCLGFEPRQGERLCPDFADVSVYRCVSPVSLATWGHLPFLPLSPALSTLYFSPLCFFWSPLLRIFISVPTLLLCLSTLRFPLTP